MLASLTGLYDFAVYFGTALLLVAVYLVVYTVATTRDQFALIRQNVVSASVALGCSLLGFALPLSSAVVHARSVADCIIWGAVALGVQIVAFWLVALLLPRLSQRIAGNEISAALLLGAASLAAGLIDAAAMTY